MRTFLAATLLGTAFLLNACDGDSRPFTEAVEVRALNLVGVNVEKPTNSLDQIFLNINQGVQLGLQGVTADDETLTLVADNRDWTVSDPAVASITDNGFLRALSDGSVAVSVMVGDLVSVDFSITVANATLSEVTEINALSNSTTLERCIPDTYFAIGTFSDQTRRNLDNLTWSVNNTLNARLFDSSGSATSLNALVAMDQLTLSATAPGGQSLDQSLVVSANLQNIVIRPLLIALDEGAETPVTATGIYAVNGGETTDTTKEADITDNVDWAVASGTDNLSVNNVRGVKGLLTGLDAGNAEITAACGIETARAAVVINGSSTSTDTTLAFKIGDQLITGNKIIISRADNLQPISIRASTGSEYDAENDVTQDIDFQRQVSTSNLTPPFEVGGSRTSTPTIRLTATGEATLVATETTDGDVVEYITIEIVN